jgi:hypothetical protein
MTPEFQSAEIFLYLSKQPQDDEAAHQQPHHVAIMNNKNKRI